jgi:hypothetical protein
VAAGQIPVTRFAGGEGRGWERQEGIKPHLIVALGGEVVDEAAHRHGTDPAAVAGGGGSALVRERARGPAVQLRCEVEKVMVACRSWVGAGELREPRVGLL